MIRIALFTLFIAFISCANSTQKQTELEKVSTTTYYLIRHDEKVRDGSKDPALTSQGRQRAIFWANHFENMTLDAVYSTNYTRTKETATPTANRQNLKLQTYDPNALYDDQFKKETLGKNVLIVGHSNTTPAFVNAIIGEQRYKDIDDSENAMLYTVVLMEGKTPEVTANKVEMN
ncbi:MAG: phosphoglycerate mutase family protein [Marinirhabdus sp.]|nr:phosphoglycerate mutase family protein [Marinirhabdus sp.]